MDLFGARKIITEKIRETELCTYSVGFDLNNEGEMAYRWSAFVNLLQNVVPEFAFGHHRGLQVGIEKIIPMIIEAAKSIYRIDEFLEVKKIYLDDNSFIEDDINDKFLKRGEFGELILHLLLRDFHGTIPLISKIYFKDSDGHVVHGFDAVHIQPESKTLWLGESKLYMCGANGIDALITDLKEHIEVNYLEREFALISKKLEILDNIEEKEYWLGMMDQSSRLKDIFNSITIPMLCTYSSDLYSTYCDDTLEEFIESYHKEVKSLEERFASKNNHKLKQHLNILLMLFPVKCKNELVKRMHKKLYLMQELGRDD